MYNNIKKIINDMKKIKKGDYYDSLSVGEVLYLPVFKDFKIVGGESGLKNLCYHMTILETPEGMSWMEGGEFLLTAGYAFLNNKKIKKNMVVTAYKKGVSAIAIKTNRYFGKIDQDLIRDANRYEIPLIAISNDVVYTETVSSFYDFLFYRKNEYILNLNSIYEKLLNLSFENKEIEGIIKSLSNIFNCNVFLFDNNNNILEYIIINDKIYNDVSSKLPFNINDKDINEGTNKPCLNYKINGSYVSFYPIIRNCNVVSFLYLITEKKLNHLDQTAVEYGKSIISMKLEKEWIIKLRQTRINKTIVETMLNNSDLGNEFYENVEKDLGWDKEGKFTGLCIKIYDRNDSDNIISRIYDILNNFLGSNNYLSLKKSDEIFVFIKVEMDLILKDTINKINEKIESSLEGVVISIGVSNSYNNLRNIKSLYNESYLAALLEKNDIVYYSLLNNMKLLYSLKEEEEIEAYYDRTVGKLEKYDKENKSNLLYTLKTYFEYNSNNTITASKLFIHVETLRYRLKRIEEITGCSINDSEETFTLQMGLKLKKILKIR